MANKVGAYGTNSSKDTSFRKEWNQEEYMAKAREKDREHQERAIEAEEYARKGQKPPRRQKDDLPKPTELMKARETPLELEKNLNKTIIVNAGAGSSGQPGFYCDICKRNHKDSVGYMDHINGRSHLRRLGQTTKVVKSTLNDVRLKIAELRAKTAGASEAKKYDFDTRLKEIKEMELKSKLEAKESKKKKKLDEAAKKKESENSAQDSEMMAAMGFGSFGAAK